MAIELLAPAGSPASLKAAVEAGADAVYLGAAWNARMRARNFTLEELAKALAYCRIEGVKSYVTLNTLVFERELKNVAEYVKFVYEYGADSLIVQDLGVARMAKEIGPDMRLHASTQMSVHNSKAARMLKDIGFKRVNLARELSLEQAKRIRENAGVEAEVFCHGAMCYSYSGKCLLSFAQTGRSGNRGVCSQLCRLPWKFYCGGKMVSSGYLTSTKDLNASSHVPQIAQAGLDSIKIEGRLKDAGYVRAVVKAYRQAIDEGTAPDLSKLTSREYTRGYLLGEARQEKLTSPGAPSSTGVKVGEVTRVTGKGAYVKLSAEIKVGDSVRASSSKKKIELYRIYQKGKEVKRAKGECILMIKTLRKGDSLFKVERAEVEDAFLAIARAEVKRAPKSFQMPGERLAFEKMPELFFAENRGGIYEAREGSACVIPLDDVDEKVFKAGEKRGVQIIVDTPRVVFDEEMAGVEEKMKQLAGHKPLAFMASDPSMASDYPTLAGTHANVCNTLAAREWKSFGNMVGVVSSIEVPNEEAEKLGFIPFTGKSIELMVSENNIFKELGMEERKDCFLEDPRGDRFPVKIRGGRTVILSPRKKEQGDELKIIAGQNEGKKE